MSFSKQADPKRSWDFEKQTPVDERPGDHWSPQHTFGSQDSGTLIKTTKGPFSYLSAGLPSPRGLDTSSPKRDAKINNRQIKEKNKQTCCKSNAQTVDKYSLCSADRSGHRP